MCSLNNYAITLDCYDKMESDLDIVTSNQW